MSQEKINSVPLPSVASLAVPIAVETLLRNLINTMNVFLLSGYSDEAAAGVGVANQVINIVLMFSMALAVGASVIINHDLGAERRDMASVSSMNSLSVAFLFGAGVSLLLFFTAGPMMRAVGLTGKTYEYASGYLAVAGISSTFLSLSQVLSTVFRSYKNARLSMLVITGANALNLLCTYLCIRFEDRLPFNAVIGVGVSKTTCEALSAAVLLTLMAILGYGFSLKNAVRFDGRRVKELFGVGASASAESLSYNIGTLLTTSFIAKSSLSALALSAKVYVGTVNPYEQTIGYSLGQAGQIIAGKLIGAGAYDEAQRRINKLWKFLMISNLSCSLLLFAFHRPIIGFFTDDPEVIALTTPLFLLEIVINFSRSMNHCFNAGNRAAGYVFWPALIALTSLWVIYVGCGYLFCSVLGLGIAGIWIAMASEETVRGVLNSYMWLTKKWRKKVRPVPEGQSGGDQALGS
ncbi:MAG: MATE family efflux transporter [Clostridia bacterium]|nr:MATE family efflux transporter [Clostridia bacterium]MBR5742987.1 MATE family efflux transporter [Clostridia bacterium]